jgi:hypothetical protein
VAEWGLGWIREPGESNSSKKLVVRLRHICMAETEFEIHLYSRKRRHVMQK